MVKMEIDRKKLIKRAREMRLYPTHAEHLLWQFLRGKQLFGLKFRRQHIISPYIVDFYCHKKKLIIEVDGGSHLNNFDQDNCRQEILELRGYRIIRFWNDEVLQNTFEVLEQIKEVVCVS
jgi:very-short-patch-repair endonuclease